jgi:type II restriction/modification system DNA methylase subunit YeeA
VNTDNIKSYAPQARSAFIASMTAQATKYGITATAIASIEVRGDIAIIGDRPFPAAVAKPRAALVQKIEQLGFDQVMEQVAYSWFNRLCAIRYMELHDYLGHGRRLLSHPDQSEGYQILDDCLDIDLPGLNQQRVRELKLDGTQDEALYRELLLAQCHALHEAMPFLFETIDDETELLLPDNLTKTDSLVKALVTAIPEEDWQDIEIIGWLYQFYISEKKDQVIGKVVKSEDIPAATQLFTPNWIVKYMVQNSLGAQWLATYPQSPLKGQMEYYIEPAEQTDEVNAQLAAITPSQLDSEELTLIDPASGSGHILVEAYELFKAIYLERGYRQRDVPQLILEKNLFGLDIDERAAQLTGFALMMKGRADDRRLFERGVKLNVMALVDSAGFDAEGLAQNEQVLVELSDYGLKPGDLTELKRLFEHATTFGSLIQVPKGLAKKLPALKQLSGATSQDLFVSEALKRLGPLVQQAELLAAQYDAVVANPPYIGNKYHTPALKKFLKGAYAGYDKDVFSAFIDRDLAFSRPHGRLAFMSPFVWMFISTHEHLRARLIDKETVTSLIQLEYSGFEGATVPICTFTLQKTHADGRVGCYVRLSDFRGSESQAPKTLEAIRSRECGWFFEAAQDEFRKIPGSPLAYWVSAVERDLYVGGSTVDSIGQPRKGMDTGENAVFLRQWWEVSQGRCSFSENPAVEKWFPYNKGGDFRRWYGNRDHVVNWISDGSEIKARLSWAKKKPTIRNSKHFFQEGFSWTTVSSGGFSIRYTPAGAIFDNGGCTLFCDERNRLFAIAALLNSKVAQRYLDFLSPTLNFQPGDVGKILHRSSGAPNQVQDLVELSRRDWTIYERSWDFESLPLLTASSDPTPTLESSYTAWITKNKDTIAEMKRLEEENNRLFIDAYGLADELTPDVPIEQITLTVNPAYRYGKKVTIDAQWTRFRQDTMEELVSYAIGCMMGRYSLGAPGLIYAHSGNEGFDALLDEGQYSTFPADDDGIVPLTDTEWFSDDACNRLVEFMSVAWSSEHLETNLNFLADNLSPKRGESSRDTLCRYLSNHFYKDHMQTYKKRPIYWLFSSGKEKAFQCLVYLHRYNQGTLARMRTEYVIPLTAKLNAHIQKLENDKTASDATSEIKVLEKRIGQLHKQQLELNHFDEKLRHYADQRIALDLDDGVKVNYTKFGDLLVDVKAITGNKPEVIA